MAEPFGIVAGTIGVVAAFSTCVEIFNYVQLGHRFGRDYWTNRLKLTVLQLRLSRWGEAVGVYRDPRLGNPAASEAEIQLAKDKFDKAGAPDDLPSAPENLADAAALAVDNRMRNTSARRQKAASILRVSSWTIHYRASLKDLIDDIASLLDNLDRLFPVPPTRRTELIQQEVAEVETTESPALATAAKGVDDALHEAAVRLSCQGHRYKDVVIEAGEDGCVLDGDAYSDNYTHGGGPTTSHLYDSVKITGTNRLRVLNGNSYGGGDFFSRK